MNSNKIDVVILGGTGFGAGELLRLFLFHPFINLRGVISSSSAGKPIASAHPHLRSLYQENFSDSVESLKLNDSKNLCFISALPHGESLKQIEKIYSQFPNSRIIDLSGDLRLKSSKEHSRFYPHTPLASELREIATYGLPELNAEKIKTARLISNPGCLATASLLATLPINTLIQKKLVDKNSSIQLSLATGSSGSGKDPKLSTHHPIRHANFVTYKPLDHQHIPEILQCLPDNQVAFVPHSLPVSRGILCTAFVPLTKDGEASNINDIYQKYYSHSPFVRILNESYPELENVVTSNFCDLSVTVVDKQLVVHTAIDNLVKGMAGVAIENLNLAFGFEQTCGLKFAAVRPV